MNKRFLSFGIAAFCILLVLWLAREKRPSSTAPTEAPPISQGNEDKGLPRPPNPSKVQAANVPAAKQEAPTSEELETYRQRAAAESATRLREGEKRWKEQLSAPINFYGKVVDQNAQPVADASVEFAWNDLPPESQTANYTGDSFTPFAYMHDSRSRTTSDAMGLCSLLDKKGKGLSVTVSKAGYYSTRKARGSFEYGDPVIGIFRPDPANPVVFLLRKKGPGADLVTSQYGVRPDLGVRAPRDGTPVRVDLQSRKVGDVGPFEISQVKPDHAHWKQATEWTFRMAIPDGGFVEQDEEFPFQAPEAGYQPAIEFHFKSGETNWATTLQRQYYIAFGQPRRYGRLVVETAIEMEGARLTYAINPDGSRYLEPK